MSKVMVRHPRPPSQTWRTFLVNHVDGLASIDLFVVPTTNFRSLYAFIVLRHERRKVIHFNVTAHPTAAWLGQQLVEAVPWDTALRYLIRDRDAVLSSYFDYCHRSRTHLSLAKDCPDPRPVCPPSAGKIVAFPQVDGLHHRYERVAA